MRNPFILSSGCRGRSSQTCVDRCPSVEYPWTRPLAVAHVCAADLGEVGSRGQQGLQTFCVMFAEGAFSLQEGGTPAFGASLCF